MIIFDYPFYRHTISNNKPNLVSGKAIDEYFLKRYEPGIKIKIIELAEGDVPGPSSTEDITVFDYIHNALEKYNVNPSDVEMIHGSFNFDNLYKKWAGKNIRIGSRSSYGFYFLQEQKKYDSVEYNENRSKHFISLNGAIKPKRIEFINFCKQNNLMHNYISLVGNYNTTDQNIETILLDKNQETLGFSDKVVPDFMNDAYLNIINETHEDDTVFMTEKTWKPILNYQLFLYWGVGNAQDYYNILLDNGFELYDEIFDYSNNIQDEILKFCNMPINEVKEKFINVKHKLEHNKKRALEIEEFKHDHD